MKKKILKITIDGFLKKSYLGESGGKDVTLSYSAKEAIEIAKIELMGRDLRNHLPVLLRTTYEISPEAEHSQKVHKKPRQEHTIRRRTSDT